MRRILWIGAGGLLGAIIIHVLLVVILPRLAGGDVAEAMAAYGPEGTFNLLPRPETAGADLAFVDPRLVHAVCRFTLEGRPLRIAASIVADFWSVAVFDRTGNTLYSLNDRTGGGAGIDLLLIGPAEVADLQETEEVLDDVVIVEMPVETGLVVLRAFYRDAAMRGQVEAMLQAASCDAPLAEGAPPSGNAPAL